MQGIAAFVRRAGEKTHVTSRLEPGTWVLHGRRETTSGKTASPETANLQRIPATPVQCVPVHKQSKCQSCAYIIDAEDRGRWRHTPAKTKAITLWGRAKLIPNQRRIPAFSVTVSPPLRPGSGNVHLAFTKLRCAGLSLRHCFCTSDKCRGQVSAGLSSSQLCPDLGTRVTRRNAPSASSEVLPRYRCAMRYGFSSLWNFRVEKCRDFQSHFYNPPRTKSRHQDEMRTENHELNWSGSTRPQRSRSATPCPHTAPLSRRDGWARRPWRAAQRALRHNCVPCFVPAGSDRSPPCHPTT